MLGYAALFFFAGFVQFNHVLNRGVFSVLLFIATFSTGIYFFGWLGMLIFLAGAVVGGYLVGLKLNKEMLKDEET